MSIGPTEKEEKPGFTTAQQTRLVGAKTTRAFFADPAQYLFLIGLIVLMTGLAFGQDFDWKFYALIAGLGSWLLGRIKIKSLIGSDEE